MVTVILNALIAALPSLIELVKQESAGTPVTDADVTAALVQAGVDESTTAALIAAAKAAGK